MLAINDTLAQATGRDNKYHQYFVTITPDAGLTDADVVISVAQFSDKVIPVANQYVPLTVQEILATTLSATQVPVRDARVKNESLTVKATTGADTTSAKALGSAAYTARKKVLDAGTNEIPLGPQLVVPANGYLVLVASVANAGVEASDQKLAQKKLKPATEDYNTMGLGLPFPADDLDNFFRNGGTLNLGYADIPAATDSGHG